MGRKEDAQNAHMATLTFGSCFKEKGGKSEPLLTKIFGKKH